jgi:hypothetical protein
MCGFRFSVHNALDRVAPKEFLPFRIVPSPWLQQAEAKCQTLFFCFVFQAKSSNGEREWAMQAIAKLLSDATDIRR